MRRIHVYSCLVLCLVASISACRDAAGPVGPTPTIQAASTEDPGILPASQGVGGAAILRFGTISFILTFDAERMLLSAHMPSNLCSPAGEFNDVEVQRVVTPSQIAQATALVTGEEGHVAIYHASSPAEAGLSADINSFGFGNLVDVPQFCSFLAGPNRIAEGLVDRVSTASRASFHARWTGTIQGVDGSDYHLTEVYQLDSDIQDPTDPTQFRETVSSILLTHLP